jgi:hypothetical protein
VGHFGSAKRSKIRFSLFLVVNLASIFTLYWFLQNHLSFSTALELGLGIVIFVLSLVSFLLFQKRVRAALVLNAFVVLLILSFFVYWIAPDLRWADSKKLALDVLPQLSKSKELLSYNVDDYVPLFYTKGQMQLTPEGRLYQPLDADRLDRYLKRHQIVWLLIDNEDLPWIAKSSDWKMKTDYGGQGISIVELEAGKVR